MSVEKRTPTNPGVRGPRLVFALGSALWMFIALVRVHATYPLHWDRAAAAVVVAVMFWIGASTLGWWDHP